MKLNFRKVAYIVAGIFVALCLYSALTEQIIPYWNSGQKHKFWTHIFGAPICIFGALVFVYGGALFTKDVLLGTFNNPVVLGNIKLIKSGDKALKQKARKENFRLLLKSSKRGAKWLAIGFAVIMLGAFIINQ